MLRLSPVAFCLALLCSCDRPKAPEPPAPPSKAPVKMPLGKGLSAEPLPDRRAVDGPRFELLDPAASGLDFRHRWRDDALHQWEFANAFAGGGVAIGDYDGDGRPDLYLTRPAGGGRLYRNLGDMRFEDATKAAGLPEDGWCTGPTFVDIDADGDLDLFVGQYGGPIRLFVNEGGRFTDQAAAMGLNYSGATVSGAFADWDNDGDLDLYLVTNRSPPKGEVKGKPIRRNGHWEVPEEHKQYLTAIQRGPKDVVFVNAGERDQLFVNTGGQFIEMGKAFGVEGFDIGLSARWWDFDDDGFLDLYVANDFFGPDRLYRNANGQRLVDVTKMALPHTPWFSMGVDVADIDGDGWMDLLATDMSGTTHYKQKMSMGDMSDDGWFLEHAEPRQYMRNALYVNSGSGRFMEAAYLAGVADTDWSWTPRFADFDEDGRVDLFVTNGMTRDFSDSDLRQRLKAAGKWQTGDLAFWKEMPRRNETNLAYRNAGDLRFEPKGKAWGLDATGISFGAALGDLDGDGDLDLVVNDFDAPARLYRNRSAGSHRITLRLRGRAANPSALGAKVTLEVGGKRQLRDLQSSGGFMSSNEALLHFGVGEATSGLDLSVRWPDGREQRFTNLAADQRYTLSYDPAAAKEKAPQPPELLLHRPAVERWRHQERPYDDFARQPLLPIQHSRLGPGLAWGDVDGDGRDDVFVGGGAGQPGLLRLTKKGGFGSWRGTTPWVADAAAEDMGAAFLDVDSDGDLDLYVVSGGVECEVGAEVLRDRLYLNEGGKGFRRAADAVPDLRDSGSAVAAADYDGDGDLDLFVGGRVIPGRYPENPRSRLLRNEGGRFVDASASLPGLEAAGMVTGALWGDLDGDHRPELVLSTEWGPVHVWRNTKGGFESATEALGLAARKGWWNAIAGADVDGDGDLDLVVGNVGLNTKYEASVAKPALLYYGAFGKKGEKRIIEADHEEETVFPVRGRSCSSVAMPNLAERFGSYSAFAKASLGEIYGEDLEAATRFAADTLESGVLINEGGRFRFEVLPRRAQLSVVSGIAIADWTGDGHPDLLLAQNSHAPQRETGRWDGGVGLMLAGHGDGTFEALPVERSGVVLPMPSTAATVADLNGDATPDLVVATNAGPMIAQVGVPGGKRVAVRLEGPKGNPQGIGAELRVVAGETSRTVQVLGGGSYLSHGGATHFLTASAGRVEVRWPSGQTTQAEVAPRVILRHP